MTKCQQNMFEGEFLRAQRRLVVDGLDHIETNFGKSDLLTTLYSLGWGFVIVPDERWPVGKTYPTEASKECKEVRVLSSYIKRNPNFVEYGDEFGWAAHELVHVLIFTGNLLSRFRFESPFEYPLNTDEIFCFGYQIRLLLRDGKYDNLMKFYECNMPYIRKVVDMIKQELFMERIAIDKTHPCGERKGFLEVRGVSRPQLLLGVHVLDFQRDGRHAQARRVFL